MRNLILSAFPRNMRLPDPFTPNLKVDLLPEINQSPRFVPEPQNLLPAELRYCFSPSPLILLPSSSHLSRLYATLVLHLQIQRCCCICMCNTRVAYDLLMQNAFVTASQEHGALSFCMHRLFGPQSCSCGVQDCCGWLSKGARPQWALLGILEGAHLIEPAGVHHAGHPLQCAPAQCSGLLRWY